MKKCCANCSYRYDLEKLDYSNGGCEHSMMDGFVCMLFKDAKLAAWMYGSNESKDHCECYQPKGDESISDDIQHVGYDEEQCGRNK